MTDGGIQGACFARPHLTVGLPESLGTSLRKRLQQVGVLFDDENFFLSQVAFEVGFQLSEEAPGDLGFSGDHAIDHDVVVVRDAAKGSEALVGLREKRQPAEFRQ